MKRAYRTSSLDLSKPGGIRRYRHLHRSGRRRTTDNRINPSHHEQDGMVGDVPLREYQRRWWSSKFWEGVGRVLGRWEGVVGGTKLKCTAHNANGDVQKPAMKPE